jgi:hypothetical protein
MPSVNTTTSSGSGLNPEDKPIDAYAPKPLSALTSSVPGSSVQVPANEYEANKESQFGLTPFSGETGSGLVDLNKMFDELAVGAGKVVQDQLAGKVPEDVQKQLRIMRAESSLGFGLGAGSQASKNVEARDLGLTSLQIQQQGVAGAQALAGLVESKRQYNKNYELNISQHMQDVRRTDLSATELMESSRRFNKQQELMAAELSASVLTSYHSLMGEYATPEKAESFTSSLSDDMRGILAKIKSL